MIVYALVSVGKNVLAEYTATFGTSRDGRDGDDDIVVPSSQLNGHDSNVARYRALARLSIFFFASCLRQQQATFPPSLASSYPRFRRRMVA